MRSNIVKKIKSAPQAPGVYLFHGRRSLLYIGKAANLKERLKNYLRPTDHKTQILDQEAERLEIIPCQSPIEALIEEARLIKANNPSLNVYWRDDKQYFYVVFTKDKYPRVFITHQPGNDKKAIGPFTDGRALKLILRIIRRHYPYCTCRQIHQRQCLNSQIGLCPGFCCIANSQVKKQQKTLYKKNIQTIKDFLSGKNKRSLKRIIQPADNWAMENIINHSQVIANQQLYSIKKIECYDISNLSGKEAVGAMTVLTNRGGQWQADKNQFRKFKIRGKETRNDPAMIAEILERRLKHKEWPYPDLIIIDGGSAQYNAARQIMEKLKVADKTQLIAFAKPNKKIIGDARLPALINQTIIERAVRQTHNFAVRFHRQTRQKAMLK